MSTPKSLGKSVLRDVSRSFYLSLRLLPRGFREPASIGYLLARLSDTIADAGEVPAPQRKELLESLEHTVRDPSQGTDLWSTLNQLAQAPGLSPGEQTLLKEGQGVLLWMQHLSPEKRTLVQEVAATIFSGQQWDLTRFEGDGVARLEDRKELTTYCYQVAGCVGEFWTKLGFLNPSRFSRSSLEEMKRLGRSYGQGLQLVNILRDVPEDWERGRCYLPGEEEATEESLHSSLMDWLQQAEEWLDEGLSYCDHLIGIRVQIASGLPVLLGKLTLQQLRTVTWEEWKHGVKITRTAVRQSAWKATQASLAKRSERWRWHCHDLLKRSQA